MIRTTLALVLVVLACCSAAVAAPGLEQPPPVRGSAWLVEDARTGEVIASSDSHERVPIASLTKMMTVLIALQSKKLSDVVTVDRRAAVVGESTINLRPGEQMTVRDLIKGALIQSANDAAAALALSISKDFPAFARLMNAKAQQLGLHDTHYVRPDGLDEPGEFSSATDVTKLGRDLMRYRFVRDTVREETASISGGRTLHTWDDLLSMFPQTIGVKTGHTDEAGWCQVAAARGRGVTVYATILGSPSRGQRNVDLQSLLIWGLGQFRVVPAVRSGRTYANVQLPYGKDALALVAAKPLISVARLGHPLTETVVAPVTASLPVEQGQVLGRVEIRDGKRLIGTRDLVASRTINKPGIGSRLGWYAGRTAHHLAGLF
ncbi:MAG TPA: D-alanyl-D-alanine carboxypeptidase family protein [Gaiellaceae bacterium]|nr:D-alanyl-D-alanine carboxypeptidase family protein [Gaiellaceae bacterium]